ncbi:WbqC family protein [Pectobacterium carotovorum]|uniref:WbqC family protein n=1 Tax=Pectobacterium carotovorum TaxID=554 RepID=UPI00057DF9A7|nr:WbqC family protein [Pectobacterium carotovorum]KHT18005.1 WbqC-like protein [Pectobacterium carotovorum subsp. carotovorum]MBB1525597.1 WbqC family protein [Pectobacterium carotovorum subsp. carotovorum]MCA6964674.1 WbqC family protein [Pectobacterium carotovorum]MCH4987107.1 WbqC family protein [Pectobacterium carotovorum]
MIKYAVMQPYFFPYIGYFQLMAEVDVFVVYDNIKYTKKGWINRNRILLNGKDSTFSLPLKKDSDFLDVKDRVLSETFNRDDLTNKIRGAYRRAPYFKNVFPLLENIINYRDDNLFNYILYSLGSIKEYLGLTCDIKVSSSINIDHSLKSQDKVLAFGNALGAKSYSNPPGGISLYSQEAFSLHGMTLNFIQPNNIIYKQFDEPFVAWLSIIDVMMFNSSDEVLHLITNEYELI